MGRLGDRISLFLRQFDHGLSSKTEMNTLILPTGCGTRQATKQIIPESVPQIEDEYL